MARLTQARGAESLEGMLDPRSTSLLPEKKKEVAGKSARSVASERRPRTTTTCHPNSYLAAPSRKPHTPQPSTRTRPTKNSPPTNSYAVNRHPASPAVPAAA
ncbi:hypothetical protein EJ04DRAFT_339139 [Polyplosphaeria fusca]|uniref:Uncharacterized protein n=1 Tax=Polyplosphaeria fusca TaxID=682080 RepID=A0A9P4QW81_9PLEO|nr:hypothetical protein EJ04DRAFT_339139 [Polyplosphaeria fusca]